MSSFRIVVGVYLAIALLYWLRMLIGVVRVRRGVARLEELASPAPHRWPRVSVVVAARDEADKIAPAARSLMQQDYPDLQLIFVDDRSSDGTGQVIARLAEADDRLRVVRVEELPDGWLGKVHALQRGLEASDGEYVLFTDADVYFAPDTLSKAIAHMVERELDHLSACPSVWEAGAVVDVLVTTFLRQLVAFGIPPCGVSDPDSPAYFGVGAFNMVRRAAFDATEGFEWLRMEVADDMGLALMMKRSGAGCGVVAAFDHVGLHWYRNMREAARGGEKSFSSIGNCRVWRLGVTAAVMGPMELAPAAGLVALAVEPAGWVGWLGASVAALFAAAALLLARWARASLRSALAAPAVALLVVLVMCRVAWLGWRRGGVGWRGTVYPAGALRAGRRVRPRL